MTEEGINQISSVRSFKFNYSHVLPQVWALIFTGLLTFYLTRIEGTSNILTIFSETPIGASLNSLIFIFPLFLSAVIFYLLIRSGHTVIVKLVIRLSLGLATFLLASWYIWNIGRTLSLPIIDIESIAIIISACLTVITLYFVYHTGGIPHALSLASISALIGTFLAFSIPLLSAIILLICLIAYDTLSVYKGPIGKLIKNADISNFTGAVFTMRDVTIGMGDMVFCSMLVSVAFLNFGIWSYIISTFGTLFGAYVTIRLLEKQDYLPGLPLVIFMGLLLMFVSIILISHFSLFLTNRDFITLKNVLIFLI